MECQNHGRRTEGSNKTRNVTMVPNRNIITKVQQFFQLPKI